MKKCRYAYYDHPEDGIIKFWYPQCYGGAEGPNLCTCDRSKKEPSEATKDKKLIKELMNELSDAYRIIEKLSNRKIDKRNPR